MDERFSTDIGEVIAKWESYLANSKSIPHDGQQELRSVLVAGNRIYRERVIELLNPRRAPIVELTAGDLREHYVVTGEDNYARPVSVWDHRAVFDAGHGYYVQARFRPLWR